MIHAKRNKRQNVWGGEEPMALARAEKEDTTPLYPKDRTELRERSSVTSALAPTSAIQAPSETPRTPVAAAAAAHRPRIR
jgi:hypothetical protein